MFDVLGELPLVGFLIFIHQLPHVISNMDTHDVFTVSFSIEVLRFSIVARESFGAVRDVNATINCTLHHTKNTCPSGGTGKTNIQVCLECSRAIFYILNIESTSGDLGATLVDCVQLELLQQLQNKDTLCKQHDL